MPSKLEEAARVYREKATAYDEARQHRLRVEQELDVVDKLSRAASDEFYAARNALAEVALQEPK